MKDRFLIVKLDQYAGNVDEIVCAALTGRGADRYGEEQAQKVFKEKVLPLLGDVDPEWPDFPVEFSDFNTEYGLMPYELDSSSTNNLRLCIDCDTDMQELHRMLDIWSKAYDNGEGCMEITVEDLHNGSVTVKVLGFDLVTTVEQRETLR